MLYTPHVSLSTEKRVLHSPPSTSVPQTGPCEGGEGTGRVVAPLSSPCASVSSENCPRNRPQTTHVDTPPKPKDGDPERTSLRTRATNTNNYFGGVATDAEGLSDTHVRTTTTPTAPSKAETSQPAGRGMVGVLVGPLPTSAQGDGLPDPRRSDGVFVLVADARGIVTRHTRWTLEELLRAGVRPG